MALKKVDLIHLQSAAPDSICCMYGTWHWPPRVASPRYLICPASVFSWEEHLVEKHLLTKPCIYLHVVEGSPLELVELLLLESSLSGGCSEHIGVGQAGKAPDIKKFFQRQIFKHMMNTQKHNYKITKLPKKYKNGCLTCTCTGSVSQKHIKSISTSGVCMKLQSVSHILHNIWIKYKDIWV